MWIKRLFGKKKEREEKRYPGWESVRSVWILTSFHPEAMPAWLKNAATEWSNREVQFFNFAGKHKDKGVKIQGNIIHFDTRDIFFNRFKDKSTQEKWGQASDLLIDISMVEEKKMLKMIGKMNNSFKAGINANHKELYDLYVSVQVSEPEKGFRLLMDYLNIINKSAP